MKFRRFLVKDVGVIFPIITLIDLETNIEVTAIGEQPCGKLKKNMQIWAKPHPNQPNQIICWKEAE